MNGLISLPVSISTGRQVSVEYYTNAISDGLE